jgi:hypothetical protein
VPVERRLQDAAMRRDHVLVLLVETVLELRRALDIREEERDGAARKPTQAPIVTSYQPNCNGVDRNEAAGIRTREAASAKRTLDALSPTMLARGDLRSR